LPTTDAVVEPVAQYYAEKLRVHGSTSEGVDWSSRESQQLRFTQLLRVRGDVGAAPARDTSSPSNLDDSGPSTILDYGCGYGALAERLMREVSDFRYIGFDVCTPMIDAARSAVSDPRCTFTDREEDLDAVDYVLASGIFNVRLQASEEEWHAHVQTTLTRMAQLSRKGFAFNILTRYADRERLRDYLFYADPCRYFKLCKEQWSRNVALLHDYSLFEFTILVRLDTEPKRLAHP
jgi:SAM-dependent methyltransferase